MSLADDLRRFIATMLAYPNPGPYKLYAPGPRALKRWKKLFPDIEVVPAYEVPR